MGKASFIAGIAVSLLVISSLAGLQVFDLAKAINLPPLTSPLPTPPTTIYIQGDGSIEPSNASIEKHGNSYVLTENLVDQRIIIQRDNVILDGSGFAIQYLEWGYSAVSLTNRTGVTVKNLNITGFDDGVYIETSSQIAVTNSNFSECDSNGVNVWSSSNVNLCSNLFTSTTHGILMVSSNSSVITQNTFCHVSGHVADHFLQLSSSTGCAITENNVINCTAPSLVFFNSSNNSIHHNNLASKTSGRYIDPDGLAVISNGDSTNMWDNGEEGNYWNDYNGTDTNGDGIGDTPYIIDINNRDNYPLMVPFIVPPSAKPHPDTFATFPVAVASIAVIVVVIGLLVYFKKHKH
jgi:parallel beta-helix repeat protein